MKKTIKVLAASLAMVFAAASMAACGGSNNSSSSASSSAASSASSSASSASEASSEAAAETKDNGTIKFGTNAEFPPFESVVAEGVIGEFDGIDMAVAKEIGERLGMEVSMENMEFDSLLVSLQNKQVDAVIAAMTVTDERKEAVDFSTPYYTATQVMIVKEDSDIAKASDMEGKKIAVVQGYTGETCVKDLGYDYEAFKKGTECIMELLNGKCDVVVIDSATAQKYIEDNEGLKIVEDNDAFSSEEYAIAVNKDNKELLEKINSVIGEMLEDGTIAEYSAKYIDAE